MNCATSIIFYLNIFNPELLKWTVPSLNLVQTIDPNRGLSQNQKRTANSLDPHNEPSHLDLHCLNMYLYRSTGLNGFTLWTGPVLGEAMSGLFLLLPCFIDFPVYNAKGVDPDQTPPSVTSDLELHCLPVSL